MQSYPSQNVLPSRHVTIRSTAPEGLTSAEANRRLAVDGPNKLPDAAQRGWSAIVASTAREPMFLLLIGASLLYLLLGEPKEGIFLVLMVVLMVGMTLYQEGRTERALQALRDLSAPTATVVRDGRQLQVAASDLVRGDIIRMAEGDRVPADALVVETSGMLVDESLLTGESVPVGKTAGDDVSAAAPPGGEGLSWVFAGTLVVQGEGTAIVRATATNTELGRIGAALGNIKPPPARLQQETGKLARRLAVLGISVSLLLVLLLGLRSGSWLEALLAGVALSMSVLPEEFPVILTVFPAIGAWRLARSQVLTRRLAAIEILGSTSVLCVDKTGTLTENRMALRLLWRDGTSHDLHRDGNTLAAPLQELLSTALLASRENSPDPIDRALYIASEQCGIETGPRTSHRKLEHEYGLSARRPAMIRLWTDQGGTFAAAKGAPETIAALSATAGREGALQAAAAYAKEGLRVLAVARARNLAPPWPDDPAALCYELVGLVALADPLRADIPAAVTECQRAGIRVVMITGDHPETARAIARQAGLAEGSVVTGTELAQLDADVLGARLNEVSVCARIVPGQKLEIVRALQQQGAVVAMTGDGVNDAPALRAADVGVAMGKRGTDVAREAAELTLLDDRFASLVQALRAGRRIFTNMRKSMRYVTAIHVPIASMALLPPLLGWPILLFPLHIVFLEMVIDPASSLAFEGEPDEPDLMRRPPRPHGEALFARRELFTALIGGFWAAAATAILYGFAVSRLPEPEARATGFSALILCNLGLLLAHRQSAGAAQALRVFNPLFLAICAGTVIMLTASLYLPTLANLFRFAPPEPVWLGGALLAALLMVLAQQISMRR